MLRAMSLRRAVIALCAVGGGALVGLAASADAKLDASVFSSEDANLRVSIPRGWRASDSPSFPGVLVWMKRGRPAGEMLVTSDVVDDATYCGWSKACRDVGDDLAEQFACDLAEDLTAQGFAVGDVQLGRSVPGGSVRWIDYDNGKRWLRHGVVAFGARVHSLVLATASALERAGHVRAFEQSLGSVRELRATGDELDDGLAVLTARGSGDRPSGSGSAEPSGSASGSGSGSGDSSASGSDDASADGSGSGSGDGSGARRGLGALTRLLTAGSLTRQCRDD
jgi:hypothetical protein